MVVSRKLKTVLRKSMTDSNAPYSSDNLDNSSVPIRLPKGEDLYQAFEVVSRSWLRLPCQSLGLPVDGPSVMSLERCAYLAGPVRSLLVLRAHSSLGGILLERCQSSNRYLQSSDEAFRELFQVYCGHFLTSFWKMEGGQAIPSQPGTPQSWPKVKPQAAVALLLNETPIEIRFWVESGRTS
jgi:hypothetical protein